ncbi:MAG: FAD-binding oxidoreductase [Rhodobacterales bacterium]|nr:FAD-binding oxidoreductase [Rhodobacterales bacterium]MDX5498786.1 FAD-binding oxidoreductase [Rhodobacterales bacterium]
MDIKGFRAALGDIPVIDDPKAVQLRSRDYYWYSPILKRQLDHVTAELVVSPRTQDEVAEVLAAAFHHKVPLTPRGAGTGNYGQAMPLSGGALLDLMSLNRVVHLQSDRVRAEAGIRLERLDRHLRAEVGAELRFFPSTNKLASLGGFIAGGSGGVGSVRWGGLRNIGNILGLKVITCEASPRVLDLEGADILKVAHAYGTNGIIVEAEMPLAPAYDWVDMIVGFDDFLDACRFAQVVAQQDGLLVKEVAPVAAPVPTQYFTHHKPWLKDGQSVVLLMVAPVAVPSVEVLIAHHGGDLRLRYDRLDEADRKGLPPVYELAWNHTTLRAIKVDPTITYLQTQYPTFEHLEKMWRMLGDEMPMHLEMGRFDGTVVFSGLPLVRFTTEERLEEIMRLHEENGCLVFNPHRYTLEEGGMKKSDQVQLAFKKEADPAGILNPGKMIAWDDPDFDFDAGHAYTFAGLDNVGRR